MNTIFKIAESIASGKKDRDALAITQEDQTDIESEINFLFENRAKVIEILNILFSNKIPTSHNFYDKLKEFRYYLGFEPLSNKLHGILLIEAYKLLSDSDAQKLLQLLIDDNDVDIFSAIFSLPIFLKEIELPFDFASNWFLSLGLKIGADLAGGDFFKAVQIYAYNFPKSGLRVLEKYLTEGLDKDKLNLASIILGAIRASSVKGDIEKDIIEQVEKKLINDPRAEFRLCYHRSWIVSFWQGVVTIEQLEYQLANMLQGAKEEVEEAFHTLYKCLLNQLTNKTFVTFTMQWLHKNTSPAIPPLAKYYVVNSMIRLCNVSGIKSRLINLSDANNLIINIQPIPLDNAGTWHDIEYYLVDRLHEDKNTFEDLLKLLVRENPLDFLEQFEDQKFDYLISEMGKSDMSLLIANLIFSEDDKQRRLGNILFQKVSLESFSEDRIEKIDETHSSLALNEFIRKPFFVGKDVSKFFIMLEPKFRTVSPELQEEFKHEMTFQAINYPGACLEKWKKIDNPSDLIKRVIESAERYFNNLKKISNSPAKSFTFPEFNQAMEKGRREFSRKISEDVRDKSVFMKLVKNFDIIYGKQWSVMVRGKLGEPTEFKEISHSIEYSRLEEIDPEGSHIRRLQATTGIKNLKKQK